MYRYSFGIMVSRSGRRPWPARYAAAQSLRGLIRRQFITRNRRMAFALAVAVVGIGVAAVFVSASWFSPGLMILPILAGGLLLWPRALLILFVIVAAMLGYDIARNDERTGFGIVATIAVTAVYAILLARVRAKLGLLGMRGDQMLVELRDRIRAQSTLPGLPEGWCSESLLRPAGGSSFGGDFVVSTCDGKMLEVAVVDVSGKGIDAATRALMLSGAFGGLLGTVPSRDFLNAANKYLLRQDWDEGFATAVHLVVEMETGNYRFHSAGHPPIARLTAKTGRWTVEEAEGPLLGIIDDADFPATEGCLDRGDALLLFTDGLVERPGRDLEEGLDRLLGAAETRLTAGFEGGADRLIAEVASNVHDDRALVVVWRT